MFWEILKASKGLPVTDHYAALWGKKIAGGWKVTEITGELPFTFLSNGGDLIDYRIYGTAEGAGVETESSEPAGYKLPLTVESGEQSQDIQIYIGDSNLSEEEYVDFGEQKVYKRTGNLWNPNTPFTEGKFVNSFGALGTDPGWRASDYVDIDFNEQYTFSVNTTAAPAARHAFYNSNKQFVSSIEAGTQTFITPNDAVYARFSYRKTTTEIMLVKGSTAPDHHIPYGVEPTDPPVPLPPIPTYKGENTLTSTETLGEVTIKGRIKEVDS